MIDCHFFPPQKYFTFIQGRKIIWCTRWSSDISAWRGTTHTLKTLLISRLIFPPHPSVFEERGDSMIILFVRHKMIFLWPLDIWNTDNRQFSANGPHQMASFISDKPTRADLFFKARLWHKHNAKGACGVFWVKAQLTKVSGGGLRSVESQEGCDSDYCYQKCVCVCVALSASVVLMLWSSSWATDRQTSSADFKCCETQDFILLN